MTSPLACLADFNFPIAVLIHNLYIMAWLVSLCLPICCLDHYVSIIGDLLSIDLHANDVTPRSRQEWYPGALNTISVGELTLDFHSCHASNRTFSV